VVSPVTRNVKQFGYQAKPISSDIAGIRRIAWKLSGSVVVPEGNSKSGDPDFELLEEKAYV
jgi:hypothetical protein